MAKVSKHELFCCLSTERFNSLLSKAKQVEFLPNTLIYCEGEPAKRFFFVLEGSVKIYRTTHEGDEHLIDIVRSGQLLADPEIFDLNHSYHNFAEALQTTKLISFSSDIFRELVHQDHQAAHNLLSYFSNALKKKNYDLEVMINCPARQRVLLYFRQLLNEYFVSNKKTSKNIELQLHMPKCQLAARLAMKPETLSRALTDLRNEGVINVVRQRVIIEKVNLLIEYTN